MKRKVFFYISLISIVIGLVCFTAAFFVNGTAQDTLFTISSLLGVLALALNIVCLVGDLPRESEVQQQEKKIVVVDVKDIPKSKEEKLYEQYEDLYKKNLITKEDLDNKRKELLGK